MIDLVHAFVQNELLNALVLRGEYRVEFAPEGADVCVSIYAKDDMQSSATANNPCHALKEAYRLLPENLKKTSKGSPVCN